MQYEAVIGLEIHVQLATQTKLFCPAPATKTDSPNTHVSPVSLALPGALPVLNQTAVDYAIMAGLALNCSIQNHSVFARKNYTYPDLPKGYQISQYDQPICLSGYIMLDETTRIGITRIHMEEDAGKLRHKDAVGLTGSSGSAIDLNRAGIPLIEIVSEPDIRTPETARAYMEKIHELVTFIGVCDGNLEDGSFRCDANVSVRLQGDPQFGTRTETKNLNSFKSVEQAIKYEINRQINCLKAGEVILQQTRHYDDSTGKTTALRTKEDANDYRYFPDPDLPPLVLTPDHITRIKQAMPPLPDVVRAQYSRAGLSDHAIKVLIQDNQLNTLFDAIRHAIPDVPASTISNWVVGPIQAMLKLTESTTHSGHDTSKLAAIMAQCIHACHTGLISRQMLKTALADGLSPDELTKWLADHKTSNSDTSDDQLNRWIQDSIQANPDVVKKIKAGKLAAANVLIGHVMKASRGAAKPDAIRDLIIAACGNTH